MTTHLRALILEDRPADAELMLYELRQAGFEVDWQRVDTEVDYLDHLSKDFDVILADYSIPQFNALQALVLLREHGQDVPFIVVTGSISEEAAVECMKQGAADYLLKDRMARLGEAVRRALHEKRLRNEKQQADEALRQRNRELAMLHRAGQALTSTLDSGQVLATVLEEMRDLLSATSSSAWLVDPETDELVCHQATGPQNEDVIGWRLPPGEGIAGWVARGGESLIVPDAQADERHFAGVDRQTGLGLRSILCVPLRVKQIVIGVLQAVDMDADHFAPADLALAEQLAATAATAIENARLYEQARHEIAERKRAEEAMHRYAERLRALRAIDGAILAAWSPEEIARSALRHIRQLVPCLGVGVVTFDSEAREAALLAVDVDGEVGLAAGTRLPLKGLVDIEALRRGKALVEEDIPPLPSADSRPSSQLPPVLQAAQAVGLRSYVAAPLIAQGELIGILALGAEIPGAFAPEHVDIAREVADQVAVGLYQARLREQVQRHVEELEQRVAERTADLSVANAELARAARLKDEFLAAMSHELRTPLNAILGLSEALQEKVYGALNERQIKSLRTIETSGRHLLELINDILDVSKIEAGRLELTVGPVSVEAVCQASLGLVKQDAHEKRLEVSSNFDSAVTTVQADVRRLKQILVNLLSNAIKFTPEGGAIGLEVVGDAEREVVHFTVWDTGIGIAPEEMKRLFQPFVQLDSSLSREHAGTGLGLVLVHRMAEMHGGGVSVESEAGKGSRFTVSLPWRKEDDQETRKQGDKETTKRESLLTSPLPVTPAPRHPITILLAEDNEANIYTISEYLQALGYRVIVARNGAEAVERALEERPDLILMDVQMPEMDGLEATRRIRATPPSSPPTGGIEGGRKELADVPIIALTALAMPGDRERCLEAGANEYLSKPVGLKGLIHVIEAQLSARAEA